MHSECMTDNHAVAWSSRVFEEQAYHHGQQEKHLFGVDKGRGVSFT